MCVSLQKVECGWKDDELKRFGHTDSLPSHHVASYLRSKDACSYGTMHEHELTRLNTSAELTGILTLHDDYD